MLYIFKHSFPRHRKGTVIRRLLWANKLPFWSNKNNNDKITMIIINNVKVFYPDLPTNLPTYLYTFLPSCLLTNLFIPTYLPLFLTTCLATHIKYLTYQPSQLPTDVPTYTFYLAVSSFTPWISPRPLQLQARACSSTSRRPTVKSVKLMRREGNTIYTRGPFSPCSTVWPKPALRSRLSVT